MAIPVSYYSETWADNTLKANGEPETGSMSIAISTLSAANYAAKSALVDALRTALDAISLGVPQKHETVFSRVVTSANPAPSNLAQRENKYLIRYHGNVTSKKFRASVPAADLSLLPNHEEFLDLTATEGLAVKTAFEAIAVSPDNDGEAVTVDSIQFVGRNT